MTFNELNLGQPILAALAAKGYAQPTPVQQQTIPHILAGKDVLGMAQTGTGKTAAFCIPVLERLMKKRTAGGIRALILTPTRELAIQVFDNLKFYGKNLPLRSTAIYGGVSQHNQVSQLKKGADILVATPGRLLDLVNQRLLSLSAIEILVLDEADRMLDMGFIHDIKRILQVVPSQRQNVFFSATLPDNILSLVKAFMKDPVKISISNTTAPVTITQSVYYVDRASKRALLKHILKEGDVRNALVFARTKYGADKIAKDLNKSGITAEAFHGNKSQNARVRALGNFKNNRTRVLVATDIAARGIDIADLPFVINYELPDSAETYTHRIGRTGRAGAMGNAVSLCDQEERGQLKNINRVLTTSLQVIDHPFS